MYDLCIFRTTCTAAKYVLATTQSEVGSTTAVISTQYNPCASSRWMGSRSWKVGANHSWVPEMFVLLARRQILPFPKIKHPNSQVSGCENTVFLLHPDSMVVVWMPFPRFSMDRAGYRATEQKKLNIVLLIWWKFSWGNNNFHRLAPWFLGVFSERIFSAKKRRIFFKHLFKGKHLPSVWGWEASAWWALPSAFHSL